MENGSDFSQYSVQTGQPQVATAPAGQFQVFRPGSQPVQQSFVMDTAPAVDLNQPPHAVPGSPAWLSAQPKDPAPEPVAQESAAPRLAENEVLLSDGRVVAVMETDPQHDFTVRKLLNANGVTLQGLGAMDYIAFMALCALESVGVLNRATGQVEQRQSLARPMTKLMLDERLMLPRTTRNLNRIVTKYNEINGVGADDSDPLS